MVDFALYCRDPDDLAKCRARGKQMVCPSCGLVGALILHGFLYGYAGGAHQRSVRGQRVMCCNRNLRCGCGHTFSIAMSWVVRSRAATAAQVWGLLEAVRGGLSRSSAWRLVAPGLSLRTGYRLWAQLARVQVSVRSLLLRAAEPPACASASAMSQMIDHLRLVFAGAPCPVAAFQECFQRCVLRL